MTVVATDVSAEAQAAALAAFVVERVERELIPAWDTQRQEISRLDGWLRWSPDDPYLPRAAEREQRQLREIARTPYVGLAVTTQAQLLAVDGVRGARATSLSTPEDDAAAVAEPTAADRAWTRWVRNGMRSRQVPLHYTAVAYGFAYAVGTLDDAGRAVLRPVSPSRMVAVYDDLTQDEWPLYAADIRQVDVNGTLRIRYYDDQAVHDLSGVRGGLVYLGSTPHRARVCPVVRYDNRTDLEGRSTGEVEPLIPSARSINKTKFDRLVTQHFNSWKVWTISGIDLDAKASAVAPNQSTGGVPEQPGVEWARAQRAKIEIRQGNLLTAASPDTKFGALPETGLAGFIAAAEADIRELAAAAQLPPVFFGEISNLSADALAMLQHGLETRDGERRLGLGESHARALRLLAALEGDDEGAEDYDLSVTWQDTSIRSLAQAVDAYGKMVQLLGVPSKALWSKLPGVTRDDVEEWERMPAPAADPITAMQQHLDATAANLAGGLDQAEPDAGQ